MNQTADIVVEFDKALSRKTNGLTIRDRLHFSSIEDAKLWVKEVKSLDKSRSLSNFIVKVA